MIIRHKVAARISLPFSGQNGRGRGGEEEERQPTLLPTRRKGEESGVAARIFHGIKVRHADSTRWTLHTPLKGTRRREARSGRGSRPSWLARRALFRWYTR